MYIHVSMKRILLATSALLLACSATAPPLPAATPFAAPPPPEISTIVVPIETSLAPLLPLIEAQLPKTIAKTDAYELDPEGRFGMKYKLTRDPVTLQMVGAGLHASGLVHYALEGCKRTRNPVNGQYALWPCISCGFGEPMRIARIHLQSRFQWAQDWTVRSTTQALPVEFPNRCRVTVLSVDITDWKLAPLVNDQLRTAVRIIDKNLPSLTNLKPSAQQVWSALQTPFEIAPRTWLVLEPADVALGPIRGTGLTVTSSLALRARTRVVVGAKPVVSPRPLPALQNAMSGTPGIRVPFDIELPYAEANQLLTSQFGGKSHDVGGAKLTVKSLRLSPGSAGNLNVEADIDYRAGTLKSYRGLIQLQGQPQFDPAKNILSFTKLQYSLDSKRRNPFLRVADRLAHEAVRSRLEENARFSLAAHTAAMKSEIERGLTRPLASGVQLRGRVTSLEPVSITPTEQGLSIRVVATGSAEVIISKWQ